MSSQALTNIAYILLASGIIMLILTVFLSVKYNLIGMLRTEFGRDKQASVFENSDDPSKKPDISITESSIEKGKVFEDEITAEHNVLYETCEEPEITDELRSQYADISDSETVIIKPGTEECDPDGTVVASREGKRDISNKEFRMIEDIIVINGDPQLIEVRGKQNAL